MSDGDGNLLTNSLFSLFGARHVRGSMFLSTALGFFGTALLADVAAAQTCPAFSYNLTNGTTADAGQVMNNFNTVRNCANTLASGGTLTNSTLSGTTALAGSGAISSGGLLGLGKAPAATFDVIGIGSAVTASFYLSGWTAIPMMQ